MPRYLLTCDCGIQTPVELGQAGGQVVCSCGKTLVVPTLRQLRQLPIEEAQAPAQGMVWRPRYGAIAMFMIVAVGAAAVCLWAQLTKPKAPPVDLTSAQKQLGENMDRLTPTQAWSWWPANHSQLAEGFGIYQHQLTPAESLDFQRKDILVKAMVVAMGIAIAAAACVALWPAGKKK